MTARFRLPGLLLACFLLASVVLYAQENDEELFWITATFMWRSLIGRDITSSVRRK